MQQEREDWKMQHENLSKKIEDYKEAAKGVSIMKNSRYHLWMDIKDLVVREWNQLTEYQEARTQVSNTSSRIATLDMSLNQQGENANNILLALQNLTDEDLQTIQVTNRGQQIKNAHRLRRKVEMVNETRELNRDLA